MTDAVLDASAVLAYLKGETGGDRLEELDRRWFISAVNVAEILTKLIDDGHDDSSARAALEAFPMTEYLFDGPLARRCAALRTRTRKQGLSLGDRACIALAEREGLPIVTADRVWATLDLDIEVVLIR